MTDIEKAIWNEIIVSDAIPYQISKLLVAAKESIKQKLPTKYYNSIDIFDQSKSQELPLNRFYDHKIEIKGGKKPPQSCYYPISGFKLQKIKEYLEDNLNKSFISPSRASYTSLIFFV